MITYADLRGLRFYLEATRCENILFGRMATLLFIVLSKVCVFA
ncbi:hypothetical protein SAMN05443245_6658 [Paraburkholderia fungorum]|uniref:Uncharacterized protein n=1 Tax=Paraburkholderia fungorum TaxID=134537 RepID=A0A1H1JLU6_9BURK|nr:hypothetical protein SAMN05443245_6658 [Paraburkholderia fungorum]